MEVISVESKGSCSCVVGMQRRDGKSSALKRWSVKIINVSGIQWPGRRSAEVTGSALKI